MDIHDNKYADRIVDGQYTIYLDYGDNYQKYKDDDSAILLCKPKDYLFNYDRLAAETNIENIMEIGVFRGGGIIFFDLFLKPKLILGIEFNPTRLRTVDEYIGARPYATIDVAYGIDQSDKQSVVAAYNKCFGTQRLDLVIDDASHWYEPTKATFEAVFPLVREGGIYAIEDWAWAHSRMFQEAGSLWEDKKALTNLVFELIALHASRYDIISEVRLMAGTAFFTRGSAELPQDGWTYDDLILSRGKSLPSI